MSQRNSAKAITKNRVNAILFGLMTVTGASMGACGDFSEERLSNPPPTTQQQKVAVPTPTKTKESLQKTRVERVFTVIGETSLGPSIKFVSQGQPSEKEHTNEQQAEHPSAQVKQLRVVRKIQRMGLDSTFFSSQKTTQNHSSRQLAQEPKSSVLSKQ